MSDPFQVSTSVSVFAFTVPAPKGQLLIQTRLQRHVFVQHPPKRIPPEMKLRQCRSADALEGGMLMLSDPMVQKNTLFTA